MANADLKKLPPAQELETPNVLRALVKAHRHLAELKGVAKTIPNEGILISTLSLQEAQSSSEIENIITTQDALYKQELQTSISDPVAKEVAHYAAALRSTARPRGPLDLKEYPDGSTIKIGSFPA